VRIRALEVYPDTDDGLLERCLATAHAYQVPRHRAGSLELAVGSHVIGYLSGLPNNGAVTGCRKMAKCFTNGQRIRHDGTANTPSTWTGTYNSSMDRIEREGEFYKTPSQFAESHYKTERPDRVQAANGWKECKCEVNGGWISTFNLPYQSN
jgi:hypothetical protein